MRGPREGTWAMSVFISYRRIDTQQAAGRVADRLMERFGREAVVIDVDTDQVGRDYRTLISEHLEDADVVLALIGPRFLAEGPDGKRRLSQPHDALRLELTRALTRSVPVVPVLVDGTEMPDPDDLPDDLRDLVFRGSVELAHHRFDRDYSFLEEHVARFLEQAPVSAGPSGTDESPSAATETAEREAAEQAAAERADREATEQADREAAEQAGAEQADREALEQEVAEAVEPVAAEEVDARRTMAMAREEKVQEAQAGSVDTGGRPGGTTGWSISNVPMWGWIVTILIIVGVLGAATALSGGGGGGDGGVEGCQDVADFSIVRLQDFLDVWSGVSPDATALNDDQTADFADIASRGQELRAKAIELSCDVEQLEADITERFDELEADGQLAQLSLDQLKESPAVW